MAGVFVHPVLSVRVALLPFTALLAAVGLGAGGYAAMVAVAVALTGAVSIELVHSELRAGADRRRRLATDGVDTTGTVNWAWRYYVGAMPMTRVTVQYVDDDGHQHQARTSADGALAAGARVRLRYLPEHPATIAVLSS